MDELGLPALTGMAAALVAFTVSAIDAFKVYILKGWASRVPAVVWYILAIGIPTGICVWLGLDWFNAVTGEQIPEGLEPYSAAATGVIVGIGASGSYKAKELAKALKAESMKAEGKAVPPSLTPPGEPGIPAPVSQNGDISNTGNGAVAGNNSQNGNRNSPDGQESQQPSTDAGNFIQSTSRLEDQSTLSNFTQYVEQSATKPVEMTSNVINVANPQIEQSAALPRVEAVTEPSARAAPAYLLNFCDTDPEIGPHFVLLDGKLYRVDHDIFEHLPNGW